MKSRKPNASTARWVRRAALSSTALSALALTAVLSGPAMATNFVWQGVGPGDFNTNTNWNPSGPPTTGDTAYFESDGVTTVEFIGVGATVNGIQISDKHLGGTTFTEQSYTFNVGSAAANILTIQGPVGIINTGTIAQVFNVGGVHAGNINFSNGSTAGDASITYNISGLTGGGPPFGGAITFHDTSNAGGVYVSDGTSGGAIFNVGGGASGSGGGTVDFFDTSSAAFATMTASGGVTGGSGGLVTFHNTSVGGSAKLTANAAGDATGGGGNFLFTDGSDAQHVTGTALGGAGPVFFGGTIGFSSTATADLALLTAKGGTAGGFGGVIQFTDTATAGHATIIADHAGDNAVGSGGGSILFKATSMADHAHLSANGGQSAGVLGGLILFQDHSSAANSTIFLGHGTSGGGGGYGQFIGNATAASSLIDVSGLTNSAPSLSNATLKFGNGAGAASAANAVINNGGFFTCCTIDPGGVVTFTTGGSAGNAQISNANLVQFIGGATGGTTDYFGFSGGEGANAVLDVSAVTTSVHIGGIGGFGVVNLGNKTLFVGSNDLNRTFNGNFVGTGGGGNLTKEGTGNWTLNGTTGPGNINVLDISAGMLQVGDRNNPGALLTATTATIDPGATLTGHGTLNAATITNNGTVAPGGTIGTLTVSTYTQTSGGLLEIEVNRLTNSELVVTPNGANLDGTIGFSFDKGIYNAPRLITFLTAAGGTTGTFSTLNSTALPSGGQPLKIVTIGPSGGPNNTLDLVFAPGSALGGTGLPSIATGLLDQSQDITSLIFRHLQDGRGGTGGSASAALMPQLAYAGLSDQGAGVPDQVAAGPGGGWASGPRVWVRPFGREADTSTSGFNTGFRDQGGGVVAGIDQRLDGGFLVGVAGAYSHDDFTTSVTSTKGSTDSWRITGYGSWESGPFAIDAQGGYTRDSIKTTRSFGPPVGTASGNHSGDEGHAAVEGSYRAQFGSANVIPWVGFDYVHLSEDAFTETGAHNFNLQVASHSNDSAQFQAGIRLNTTIQMDGGWSLTPEARLGVSEELASTSRTATAMFPGVPQAGSLLLTGVTPDRTAGIAGVGLVAKANQSLDLFIDADGRFSSNQKAGIVSAGLRWTFGAPAPMPPPAAPPAPMPAAQPAPPPPSQAQVFVVYFDFDKSVLTPEAVGIIRQAADTYKRTGAVTIKVDGYTDLSGTAQYNLGLSKRRADAVRGELVKDGVTAASVAEAWHGEDNPAVPTPNGVREPRNRRATIALP